MAIFTEVFEDVTKQGRKLQTSEYKECGKYAIIDQGQNDIAGYTDEEDGVFTNVPAIVFGDHTRVIKYIDSPCYLGADGVKLLKAKIPNPNYKYLYYTLLHADIPNTGYNRHFKWLKEVNINLPDDRKQQETVDVLDKINDLVSLRRQQLAKLDDLVKARFVELFGDPVTNEKNWPRLTLGDICEIGSSKRVFEKDYVPSGIPFFRTKEIVELSKGNPISTELFITEEHFAELKKSYGAPKKDDLLISAVGTIGTIWIVSGDFEFYFKDGNLIQIKSSPNFNSIFMKYLLDELIANYKKEMSTGTAYSALTIAGLKKMLVYDVPLEFQEKFATFVEQTDKSKLAIQQSLDKLETLKKSLMQKYFG